MIDILFLFIPLLLTILFQFLAPFKPSKKINYYEIERNKARYDKLETLSLLFIPISVICIGFPIYYFGIYITEYKSLTYEYIMKPPIAFWGIIAVLLGIGLLRLPMYIIYKLFLGKEYDQYQEYTNMKHGYIGLKIWRPIEAILTFTGMSLFIFGLNWYVRIDEKKIEFNDLLPFSTQTYSISEISEINHYSHFVTFNGYKKNKEYYVIRIGNKGERVEF